MIRLQLQIIIIRPVELMAANIVKVSPAGVNKMCIWEHGGKDTATYVGAQNRDFGAGMTLRFDMVKIVVNAVVLVARPESVQETDLCTYRHRKRGLWLGTPAQFGWQRQQKNPRYIASL
jgi:hypothetical protein